MKNTARKLISAVRLQKYSGKLIHQQVNAADLAGPLVASRLFYVTDRRSGGRFLVDTGAAVSVLPVKPSERRRLSPLTLKAANDTRIRTFGRRVLGIDLSLRRLFNWSFIVADVSQPILGADFLRHYGLLVDLRASRLYGKSSNPDSDVTCVIYKQY